MKHFGAIERFLNPSPFIGQGFALGDISVTAASVVPGPGAPTQTGIFGETVTAGQLLYKDASNSNKLMKASTLNSATAECVGVSLDGGAAGQPGTYQTSGEYTVGGTCAIGVAYGVSDTAGAIALVADNGTGDFGTIFGIGRSTTKINIGINPSRGAKA